MSRWISLIAVLIAFSMPVKAQTDTPEEWRKQVIARVVSNKRYPPGVLGQTGAATVFFVLDRRGRLVSHWLTESTGHRALDEESLAIVERAQPFPAPPPNLEEDRLRLAIVFDYRLPPGQSGSWEQEQARLRAKVNSICRGC
jgi:protein TonB